MDFPQFRKYSNNLSYFKIFNSTELEEIKIMGKYYQLNRLKAIQLPDRNFVSDLLLADSLHVLTLAEAEFQLETAAILSEKILLV